VALIFNMLIISVSLSAVVCISKRVEPWKTRAWTKTHWCYLW